MNRVIQVLNSEHRLIAWATTCLECAARDSQESGDLRVVTSIKLLEFFEHFVDAAHQEKEERCIFPVLLACGLGERRMQAFVQEHGQERASLGNMRQNLEGAAYNDSWSRDVFLSNALFYASSVRQHAKDEERILMPLIAKYVGPKTERKILEGFRRVDEALLPKPRQHYLALVYQAAERLGSNSSTQIFPWVGRRHTPQF